MRIALDAMGTDGYPAIEVRGAVEALSELPDEVEILLVGARAQIQAELERYDDVPDGRLHVIDAPDRIEPGASPVAAVRRKPESSIVKGVTLQREGSADAFVSAGSTGAVMAASLFVLRSLPGVDRPPIATVLPTSKQPVVMVDAGANVDSKPFHLLQFAQLAVVYAQDVLQRSAPRVGLLNIGEEREKGNELSVETHRLLGASGLNFVGNVEGRDIIGGKCDVLVTDGFVGNVLLKFYESVAELLHALLVRELEESHADINLDRVLQVLDYTEYGGAPLLGVNGLSIICHGGSPPRAIKNAVRVAVRAIETDMVAHIRRAMADQPRIAEGA